MTYNVGSDSYIDKVTELKIAIDDLLSNVVEIKAIVDSVIEDKDDSNVYDFDLYGEMYKD